jgi:hypothetical protein
MPETRITLSAEGCRSVSYRVKLDKRYGMNTQESYDAEVARIVAMGEEAGVDVKVEVSDG